jgi:hypothetical protein
LVDQITIHKKVISRKASDRKQSAKALVSLFEYFPDKEQAWRDLFRLAQDKNIVVRKIALEAFGTVAAQAPNKNQAWKDLFRLSQNEDIDIRSKAADALGIVASQISYKRQTCS